MSNRTKKANNAVLNAWKKEKELVLQGKGTRDWTEEQQKDIIEFGKAYDVDGKAFEGHHMMSVEKYPQFQEEPKNIQFLTRNEHEAAHNGNFQNSTSGYYDYKNKVTIRFNKNIYIPCKIITLSKSIVIMEASTEKQVKKDKTISEIHNNVNLLNKLKKINNKLKPYYSKAAKTIFVTVLPILVHTAFNTLLNKSSKSIDKDNNMNNDEHEFENKIEPQEQRESPIQHQVSVHFQRYHTKDGIINKQIDAYTRGDKKDED